MIPTSSPLLVNHAPPEHPGPISPTAYILVGLNLCALVSSLSTLIILPLRRAG